MGAYPCSGQPDPFVGHGVGTAQHDDGVGALGGVEIGIDEEHGRQDAEGDDQDAPAPLRRSEPTSTRSTLMGPGDIVQEVARLPASGRTRRLGDQRIPRQPEDALGDLVAGDLGGPAGDRHGPRRQLGVAGEGVLALEEREAGPTRSACSRARSWPCSASTSLVTLPSGPGPAPTTARWARRRFSTLRTCSLASDGADCAPRRRGRGRHPA